MYVTLPRSVLVDGGTAGSAGRRQPEDWRVAGKNRLASGWLEMLKLYNYFRSSASYRVRIALRFKGLAYDYAPVHLLKEGGQQLSPSFRALNPDSLVPVLEDDGDSSHTIACNHRIP